MSRQLPERPSLDHLRKQAKVLLRELKRRDPGPRLTAAQHALALEHGFASWRDLRAHVRKLVDEGGEVSSVDLAFNRYTPTAKLALFFSRDEASQEGRFSIEPEHVLLGSIRAGRSSTARFFERACVHRRRTRRLRPQAAAPNRCVFRRDSVQQHDQTSACWLRRGSRSTGTSRYCDRTPVAGRAATTELCELASHRLGYHRSADQRGHFRPAGRTRKG